MTYCTQCGTLRDREAGSQFCPGCGAGGRVSAATFTRRRPQGRFPLALAALVLVLGGGGVAAWATLAHHTALPAAPSSATQPNQPQATTSPSDQTDPPPTASALLRTATVSTSCARSSPAPDAGGTVSTYEPEKAIDGLANTAWRCDGRGVGQWLRIDFGRKVTLTSIGIIPGFAKTDPINSADRYAQNRRISAVQYTFDDGSAFRKDFNTSASRRAVQTMDLPSISTSQVTITILDSVPGEVIDGVTFDQVAISEVVVSP